MHAEFRRSGGSVVLDLTLKNGSGGAMSGFHIQFNKNACGLKPPNTRVEIDSLPPGTCLAFVLLFCANRFASNAEALTAEV